MHYHSEGVSYAPNTFPFVFVEQHPVLIPTSSITFYGYDDRYTTVLFHYFTNIFNEFFFLCFGWPSWPLMVEVCLCLRPLNPLLYPRHFLGFITKGGLNLPDSFHLCIMEFVAESNAVALLNALRHVAYGR